MLKKPTRVSGFDFYDLSEVITIGSKIFVFQENGKVNIYDFEKNEWSISSCEATKNIKLFSILKFL